MYTYIQQRVWMTVYFLIELRPVVAVSRFLLSSFYTCAIVNSYGNKRKGS